MRAAALLPIVLVLVASLGAGCLDPAGRGDGGTGSTTGTTSSPGLTGGPSTPPPPPAGGPTVVDLLLGFGLEHCRGISLLGDANLADVQALLPAGFDATDTSLVDLGLGSGRGTIGLDLYACGDLTVGGQSRVQATYYGQVYTFIERPAERVPGAPEAARQEYVLRVLAGADVLAQLWPAAGYDTRSGPAHLDIRPAAPDLPVEAGLRTADGGAAEYTLTASGNTFLAAPLADGFARYTALADGSVLVWTGTYAFEAAYQGRGAPTVPGDDPFANLWLGAPTVQALLWEDGSVVGMDLRRVFTPLA